ncbi:MAG: hypothetical protein MJZ93_05740 [Paludibacteraceae bacterium]|nr:hypothetical protein [Paludibacteraceae bacterium]
MAKNKRTMTKAQCELVTSDEVVNYIKSIARKYGNKYKSVGYDEFFSIGMAAACERAMHYKQNDKASFLTFMALYANGEMAYFVQKYVGGMYLDKQERFFASIVSIEEMGRGDADDDDSQRCEDIISFEMINRQEQQELLQDRIDNVMEMLTPDECELIAARFGFTDNHGVAAANYMLKHKIGKSTFYQKAEAVLNKVRTVLNK